MTMDLSALEAELVALGGSPLTRCETVRRVAALIHCGSITAPLPPTSYPFDRVYSSDGDDEADDSTALHAAVGPSVSAFAAGFDAAAVLLTETLEASATAVAALFRSPFINALTAAALPRGSTAARLSPFSSRLLVTGWACDAVAIASVASSSSEAGRSSVPYNDLVCGGGGSESEGPAPHPLPRRKWVAVESVDQLITVLRRIARTAGTATDVASDSNCVRVDDRPRRDVNAPSEHSLGGRRGAGRRSLVVQFMRVAPVENCSTPGGRHRPVLSGATTQSLGAAGTREGWTIPTRPRSALIDSNAVANDNGLPATISTLTLLFITPPASQPFSSLAFPSEDEDGTQRLQQQQQHGYKASVGSRGGSVGGSAGSRNPSLRRDISRRTNGGGDGNAKGSGSVGSHSAAVRVYLQQQQQQQQQRQYQQLQLQREQHAAAIEAERTAWEEAMWIMAGGSLPLQSPLPHHHFQPPQRDTVQLPQPRQLRQQQGWEQRPSYAMLMAHGDQFRAVDSSSSSIDSSPASYSPFPSAASAVAVAARTSSDVYYTSPLVSLLRHIFGPAGVLSSLISVTPLPERPSELPSRLSPTPLLAHNSLLLFPAGRQLAGSDTILQRAVRRDVRLPVPHATVPYSWEELGWAAAAEAVAATSSCVSGRGSDVSAAGSAGGWANGVLGVGAAMSGDDGSSRGNWGACLLRFQEFSRLVGGLGDTAATSCLSGSTSAGADNQALASYIETARLPPSSHPGTGAVGGAVCPLAGFVLTPITTTTSMAVASLSASGVHQPGISSVNNTPVAALLAKILGPTSASSSASAITPLIAGTAPSSISIGCLSDTWPLPSSSSVSGFASVTSQGVFPTSVTSSQGVFPAAVTSSQGVFPAAVTSSQGVFPAADRSSGGPHAPSMGGGTAAHAPTIGASTSVPAVYYVGGQVSVKRRASSPWLRPLGGTPSATATSGDVLISVGGTASAGAVVATDDGATAGSDDGACDATVYVPRSPFHSAGGGDAIKHNGLAASGAAGPPALPSAVAYLAAAAIASKKTMASSVPTRRVAASPAEVAIMEDAAAAAVALEYTAPMLHTTGTAVVSAPTVASASTLPVAARGVPTTPAAVAARTSATILGQQSVHVSNAPGTSTANDIKPLLRTGETVSSTLHPRGGIARGDDLDACAATTASETPAPHTPETEHQSVSAAEHLTVEAAEVSSSRQQRHRRGSDGSACVSLPLPHYAAPRVPHSQCMGSVAACGGSSNCSGDGGGRRHFFSAAASASASSTVSSSLSLPRLPYSAAASATSYAELYRPKLRLSTAANRIGVTPPLAILAAVTPPLARVAAAVTPPPAIVAAVTVTCVDAVGRTSTPPVSFDASAPTFPLAPTIPLAAAAAAAAAAAEGQPLQPPLPSPPLSEGVTSSPLPPPELEVLCSTAPQPSQFDRASAPPIPSSLTAEGACAAH